MDVILLIVHVCLALAIITLVLLQKGKGASEGATFGGGASSMFGASGSANFLSKTTAILATGFFINSLALAYLAANRDTPTSVVDAIEMSTGAGVESEQAKEILDSNVPVAAESGAESDVPAAADAPAESELPPPAE